MPVARSAAGMDERQYVDLGFGLHDVVHEAKRKTPYHITSCTIEMAWPAQRCIGDHVESLRVGSQKCIGRASIALGVPACRLSSLGLRDGMNDDGGGQGRDGSPRAPGQ